MCDLFIIDCKKMFFNLPQLNLPQGRRVIKMALRRCFIFPLSRMFLNISFPSTTKPFATSISTCGELGSVNGLLVSFLGKLTTLFFICIYVAVRVIDDILVADTSTFCQNYFSLTFSTFFADFLQVVVKIYYVSCIICLVSFLSCCHKCRLSLRSLLPAFHQ